MNFFLIANNDNITDKTINNLHIKEEDIIILYNKQLPLKWEKIKDHKNKILFLRENEKGYHGEHLLNKVKNMYNEIILTSPLVSSKQIDDYKNKYELENLSSYSYDQDVNNLNLFNSSKSPQSGLISYIYILNNLKFNKIYLIGFTNVYGSGIWKGHSKEIEQNFYKNELEKEYVIKIDN